MQNKLTDLRNHLFATIESLRDEEKPMEVDRARAIAQVANTLIETAKVEVKLYEATGLEPGADSLFTGGQPRLADGKHPPFENLRRLPKAANGGAQ